MDSAEPRSPEEFTDILDKIAGQVLAAMAREEPLSPAMVLVLIRSYMTTGREEVAAGLSAALTAALEHRPSGTLSDDRPAWLLVFLEAANVSDDERVDEEAAALTAALRSEWPARSPSNVVVIVVGGMASRVCATSPEEELSIGRYSLRQLGEQRLTTTL